MAGSFNQELNGEPDRTVQMKHGRPAGLGCGHIYPAAIPGLLAGLADPASHSNGGAPSSYAAWLLQWVRWTLVHPLAKSPLMILPRFKKKRGLHAKSSKGGPGNANFT